LQRAGIDLQLILRDAASLALWQRSGAIILQRDAVAGGDEPIAVPAISAVQVHGPVTKLLVCTKAQQTLAAVASLQAVIDPSAALILLQNGMGVREQLAALLPQTTILHALSTEGAYQNTRFHIVHAARGETVIGALQPQQQALACAASAELHCELNIAAVDDIDTRLWLKLAVNSVINPLTALHQCRNGELLQLPHIDATIQALCAEFAAIASAAGQALSAQQASAAVYRVIRSTAANRSSMLQDIEQRRCTEIDFINGYIVAQAQASGLFCPQHQKLLQAIKQKETSVGCR
jgi:2-dehydropantoate 2-reductase